MFSYSIRNVSWKWFLVGVSLIASLIIIYILRSDDAAERVLLAGGYGGADSGALAAPEVVGFEAVDGQTTPDMPKNLVADFAGYLARARNGDAALAYRLSRWLQDCKDIRQVDEDATKSDMGELGEVARSCLGVTTEHFSWIDELMHIAVAHGHVPAMVAAAEELDSKLRSFDYDLSNPELSSAKTQYLDIINKLAESGSAVGYSRLGGAALRGLLGERDRVRFRSYRIIAEADWSQPLSVVLDESRILQGISDDEADLRAAVISEVSALYPQCCFGKTKLDARPR